MVQVYPGEQVFGLNAREHPLRKNACIKRVFLLIYGWF